MEAPMRLAIENVDYVNNPEFRAVQHRERQRKSALAEIRSGSPTRAREAVMEPIGTIIK